MKKLKNIDDFSPVDISRLIVGQKYPVTLYIKEKSSFKPFLPEYTPLSAILYSDLRTHFGGKLYVATEQRAKLMALLASHDAHLSTESQQFKDYAFWKEKYFRIDPEVLCNEIPINFSLYVQNNMQFEPYIEVSPNEQLDLKTITLPKNKDLLIKSSDTYLYQTYLKSVEAWAKDTNKPTLKTIIAKEHANIILKDIFDNQITMSKFEQLKELVTGMASDVLEHPYVFNMLLHVKRQDYYSYLHSVNVGLLSMALSVAIGMSKKDVIEITIGAMIHDVGKCKVPVEILNKMGRLTDFEFQIYKTHVIEGKKIVEGLNNLTPNILQPVVFHHEKLSGRGYPYKVTGDKIGLAGRITAISDCYDALTTPKPSKYPLSPYNALQIICKETKDYDPKLLTQFVKMMGRL